MKRIFCVICLLIATAFLAVSIQARNKKTSQVPIRKIYMDCHAYTNGSSYTALRSEIAGNLTKEGHILASSSDVVDFTVQVFGTMASQQKTDFGAASIYLVEVNAKILIDLGSYGTRICETILSEQGKHTMGFDEAAIEAYKLLVPQICETIKQYIK